MSDVIVYAFPGMEKMANSIATIKGYHMGKVTIRQFPDEESFVRIHDDIVGKSVIVVCSLDNPDSKLLQLIFIAANCRDLGATEVSLIAPYLGYMRQDKRFNPGEAVTSEIVGDLISQYFDWIITADPHLHRHNSMDEVYSIPAYVVHTMPALGAWIKENVHNPLIIGPDEESEQWAADVANNINCSYIILTKIRHGDKDVEISVPDVSKYGDFTAVLVDDIISTARTMARTIEHLDKANIKKIICIGVHGLFSDDGYETLKNTTVSRIVTTNTIVHETNCIDIDQLIVKGIDIVVKSIELSENDNGFIEYGKDFE